MHPPSPLADTLIRHLGREEALLRTALANVTAIHAALRCGDLATALGISTQALAAELREAADDRSAAATALAREVARLSESGSACLALDSESRATGEVKTVTLTALAANLPEPHAAELLATRVRLAAVTAELAEVQARNANLITHLRSYFRGVLSELTAPEAPLRYGPSGSRLEPAAVPARITS